MALGSRLAARELAVSARAREFEVALARARADADALRHELSESGHREQELHAALAVEHQRYRRLRERKLVRAALRMAAARDRVRARRPRS
jgi:hypothetical protein